MPPNKHWKNIADSHAGAVQSQQELATDIETALKSHGLTKDLPPDVISQIAFQGAQLVMMQATALTPTPYGATDGVGHTGPA